MNKKANKTLKRTLFLGPTIIIVLSFCVMLITFNLAIKKYVKDMVYKNMIEELENYDLIYNSSKEISAYKENTEEDEGFINIYSMITDEKRNLLFPDSQWNDSKEVKCAKDIFNHCINQNIVLSDGDSMNITVNNNTYAVYAKKYRGIYEDSYILKAKSEDFAKDYTVIIYSNITPIQDFLNLLHKVLLILVGIFGLFGMIAMLSMAKGIDKSFNKLKQYIIKVGKREHIEEWNKLDYKEFNEVLESVKEMSKMIDDSEEKQKQFFQNASHELRTPLMSIQGYAEGLKTGIFKEKEVALDVISQESEKMSELINEMLFLSNSQEIIPEMEKIDISEMLYNCKNHIVSIAEKKHINVECDFDTNGEIFVYADERRLERAFLNIIVNAVRYAKSELKIICKIHDKYVKISITDDGEGISKEDLPHIFERFYKGKGGNFGIGLSITHEVVSQHNGSINVMSDGNKTEFEITLPIMES